jgi:hypothetical protein
MKVSEQICADIELRLVDGQRPADDPALASHVRSCLRCFRTATDLRQVPHIAALLRDLAQPDPGDLFWAKFPKTVADAWEKRHAPGPSPWQRITRWFQLPIPAALAGAAVAAALVVLVTHRSPTAPVAVRSTAAPLAAAPSAEPALEDETASLVGDDDPLELLDLSDPQLVARVEVESAAPADDGAETDSSTLDEVEQLDGDELTAVAQALHGRQI